MPTVIHKKVTLKNKKSNKYKKTKKIKSSKPKRSKKVRSVKRSKKVRSVKRSKKVRSVKRSKKVRSIKPKRIVYKKLNDKKKSCVRTKVAIVMREFKNKRLKSSAGYKVKNPKQGIAIALAVARKACL